VTLRVVDKATQRPVQGVELRLGMFRVTTNDAGLAQLHAGGGAHDVTGWKIGYEILSRSISVAGDADIQLELVPADEPEQPYWM
jgi:hypothetical protein